MPERVSTEPGRDRGPAILTPARFGGHPGPVRQAIRGDKLLRLLGTTDANRHLLRVAHFHYVLLGTIDFAAFGGVYFWFPKMTGRLLDERLGKAHFWTMFVGFHATFQVQHWLGDEGMPRRYSDY